MSYDIELARETIRESRAKGNPPDVHYVAVGLLAEVERLRDLLYSTRVEAGIEYSKYEGEPT